MIYEYTEKQADTGRKGQPYPSPGNRMKEQLKPKTIGFYIEPDEYEKLQKIIVLYQSEGNVSRAVRLMIKDMHAYYFEGKGLPALGVVSDGPMKIGEL